MRFFYSTSYFSNNNVRPREKTSSTLPLSKKNFQIRSSFYLPHFHLQLYFKLHSTLPMKTKEYLKPLGFLLQKKKTRMKTANQNSPNANFSFVKFHTPPGSASRISKFENPQPMTLLHNGIKFTTSWTNRWKFSKFVTKPLNKHLDLYGGRICKSNLSKRAT